MDSSRGWIHYNNNKKERKSLSEGAGRKTVFIVLLAWVFKCVHLRAARVPGFALQAGARVGPRGGWLAVGSESAHIFLIRINPPSRWKAPAGPSLPLWRLIFDSSFLTTAGPPWHRFCNRGRIFCRSAKIWRILYGISGCRWASRGARHSPQTRIGRSSTNFTGSPLPVSCARTPKTSPARLAGLRLLTG